MWHENKNENTLPKTSGHGLILDVVNKNIHLRNARRKSPLKTSHSLSPGFGLKRKFEDEDLTLPSILHRI